MKKFVPVFLCLSFLLATSCNEDDANPVVVNNDSCLPLNLENGLIAAYSFGGGSLNDAVGSADLTASNAQPASDREGNANCAYVLRVTLILT